MTELHPSDPVFTNEELHSNPILQFFHYAHLPPKMQERSKQFCLLACNMVRTLEPSAERTAGLRKLLEAKDCFVRCQIMEPQE